MDPDNHGICGLAHPSWRPHQVPASTREGTPEQIEKIRVRLGLDRPLIEQYGTFLWKMVTFDFGNALTQGERPIKDELGERLPATIELAIPAMALTALIGIFRLFGQKTERNQLIMSYEYSVLLFIESR